MKRLLVLVLAVLAVTNPVRAIEPIGIGGGGVMQQCPAYPILPSKSAILGGTIGNQLKNTPYFQPNVDLSSGQVCLDLNSLRFSPESSTFLVRSNPEWDKGDIQTIRLVQNNIDGSRYFVDNATELSTNFGYTIDKKFVDERWRYTVYGPDLKPVFKLSTEEKDGLLIYPISKKYFFCKENSTEKILDGVGKTIVSGGEIIVSNDPNRRYVFVEKKLFDLDRKSFVELPIQNLLDIKFFKFQPDYLEIISQCDSVPDCAPHVWRINYKWELVEEFDVEFPHESTNFICHEIYKELMISFDKTNDEKCGWYFYDYNLRQTKLFLSCSGFSELAEKYFRRSNVMLIPNPDGAWVVDLDSLTTNPLDFPLKSTIIKTDNGLFAVDKKESNGLVSGCILDDDLKPIESTRTYLADGQNYLGFKNKLISFQHEIIRVFDKIKKIELNEIRLTVWCSLPNDVKPKKVGYFKFKSQYEIPQSLCCLVFKDKLYIPTGVADWFSIDLTTFKAQSFNDDELFFNYGKMLDKQPEFYATDMCTVFVHKNQRLFIYDNWKNRKVNASIEQESSSEQRVWAWWDKVIVAGQDKTTIFKLDGTNQALDGKAVSFSNGWLQMLINEDVTGVQNLVGFDVDTQYKKLIWSKVGDNKKFRSYESVGYDYQIGSNLFDREGSLVQTGITDLSSIKVESGSAIMTSAVNGIKSCGSDYFVTKWTPAPQYAIARTYKNEFEIRATRGDGKNEALSGTIFVCKWGDDGKLPNLAKLDEVTKVNGLKFGDTMRFRVRVPSNSALVDDTGDVECFALVFIGNGLLDVEKSLLVDHEYTNRARFDGTPIDALNQIAVSLTVWDEQP